MNKVVPHNAEWKHLYQEEATILAELFGSAALHFHHMGSTSVPDILAKPIIDILVEASSVEALDSFTQRMNQQGYEAKGEFGIKGRRYFKKPASGDRPGFHVHAYRTDSFEVHRHLAFRNYLLLKPEIARDYSQLKSRLGDANGVLRDDYQDAKAPFVDGIALEALAYFSNSS